MTPDDLDVDALLAPGSPGGVVDAGPSTDLEAVAAGAARRAALVARLTGPASKEELFDMLAAELRFPVWFGRNWDALEELLVYPEPPDDRPTLIVWDDADRLADADPASASTLRDVVGGAAEQRAALGAAPLVLIVRRGAKP